MKTLSIPVPRVAPDIASLYAGFLLVLAMLFGGGTRQGAWSDVPIELASLPLLAWAIFSIDFGRLGRLARFGFVIMAAIVLIPLVQLIPLPPALWSLLPGRGAVVDIYAAAGTPLPWLAVSLEPSATWLSLLSLLPAVSIVLAMLVMSNAQRWRMVSIVLAAAAAGIVLDLLQIMGGPDSPLRFYTFTNLDRAVGFFANANHNAAFLYAAVPLTAAWAKAWADSRSPFRIVGLVASAALFCAIFVALALTHSRAGLALGLVAAIVATGLVVGATRGPTRRRVLILGTVANVAALLLAFQTGFVSLSQRIEDQDVFQDLRWPVAESTFKSVKMFFPVGSGLGTFTQVHEMYAPRTLARQAYVNHAHDDWLELGLEAGLPAMVLVLGFLAWYAAAAAGAWRPQAAGESPANKLLARAASVSVLLILVHSAVDYPLRTIALMMVFAMCCTLMLPPSPQAAPERGE